MVGAPCASCAPVHSLLICFAGHKASDASSKATVPAKAMPSSGGRYELVQSLLEDMGSKARVCAGRGFVGNASCRICCLDSRSMITAMTSLVLPLLQIDALFALILGAAELSPADVDEMIGTLQMNAGQKIKFRRELKKRGLCQG
jgi:hypothetical protein